MANNKDWFEQVNHHFKTWLESVKQSELLDVNEFLRQTKENLLKAEQASEAMVEQLMVNLQHDFSEFYQQTKTEAKHSVYLALIKERCWQELAELTDKSQVEWAELADDIQHHGEYQQGDVIGFGILQCQKCKQQLHITHLSEVAECAECGHDKFIRILLEP